MNAVQFSSALGKVNDKYIIEAITYERKKKSGWLKWGALAACFCLVVFGCLKVRDQFIEDGECTRINHNITITGDSTHMYYISDSGELYLWDMEQLSSKKISTSSGEITRTDTGLYFVDDTGKVYSISDTRLTLLGSIDASGLLVNVIGEDIFYRILDEQGSIKKTNITTKTVTEVIAVSDGILTDAKIIGDNLYYYVSQKEGFIVEHNLTTSTEKTVFTFSSEDNSRDDVTFLDEIILIFSRKGLYYMNYGNSDLVFLTEYLPDTDAIDFFNNSLFFTMGIPIEEHEGHRSYFVSINLSSGELTVLEDLTNRLTYTEIAVNKDGYFYTEPSAASGGLFYCSYNSGQVITVCGH